jgi:hypothetical protein
MDSLAQELRSLGIRCRVGNLKSDISVQSRGYFERWLSNRDGFIKIQSGNIDYIGVEEVMRMGPFFNIYCLIQNQYVNENDENAYHLFVASPFFTLRKARLKSLGWSGGILADLLSNDNTLNESFAKNIMKQEARNISVNIANFACVIQTFVWEPYGLVSIYDILDRIGLNIKKLMEQIHLGEKL